MNNQQIQGNNFTRTTSFKSNNELLHHHNKTPTTPTQRTKTTTLITGDSVLYEIDENRLSGAKPNSVKVRISRGTTTYYMKDILKQYLKRSPTNIILHVGSNNSTNDSSGVILNKLLSLKNFIHTELPESIAIP